MKIPKLKISEWLVVVVMVGLMSGIFMLCMFTIFSDTVGTRGTPRDIARILMYSKNHSPQYYYIISHVTNISDKVKALNKVIQNLEPGQPLPESIKLDGYKYGKHPEVVHVINTKAFMDDLQKRTNFVYRLMLKNGYPTYEEQQEYYQYRQSLKKKYPDCLINPLP